MSKKLSSLDYAKLACLTIINKYKPGQLPPENHFHYHQGVFLAGVEKTFLVSKDKRFYDYLKSWFDYYIDESGEVKYCNTKEFDDIQPASLLFNLYNITKDERYKKVIDDFLPHVLAWPTNSKGGFFHKFRHPNQMWLDGLYMIGPYLANYAFYFNKAELYDIIHRQLMLMKNNMTDSKTGLLYHAWDESKKEGWSDSETGLSSQFWGRAIGWYVVAIQEILPFLPVGLYKDDFIKAGREIIASVVKFQDESGLWYQVVNRPDDSRNFLEVSSSSLYTYGIILALKAGIIGKEYESIVHKAYNGITGYITIENNELIVPNICIGTGVGDYEFYLNRPTIKNDLHGMGAFILMVSEYANYFGDN